MRGESVEGLLRQEGASMEMENTSRDRSAAIAGDSQPPRARIHCGEGLPLTLRFLFALNGFSLAFPVTGLLYIVNTRVEMSVSLIPAYGAFSFLPFSLRPLYAYLSRTTFRDRLFSFLLLLHSASLVMTALIPRHGVVLCFLVAFVRGATSAWPEFLLGLTLIDMARIKSNNFEETCAQFQAQAATSRHLGSFFASIGALAIISRETALQTRSMNLLFFVSAAVTFCGAGVAAYHLTGRQQVQRTPSSGSEPNYESILTEDLEGGQEATPRSTKVYLCRRSLSYNVLMVLFLQAAVVLFALQQPLQDVLTRAGWQSLAWTCVTTLLCIFGSAICSGQWQHSQKVGLFLILRHLMPSVSYVMSSYLYDVFATVPYMLQLLPLADMAVSSASAWSYGKLCARFSSDSALPLLIVGTTLFASIMSLPQVWLVHILPHLEESPWLQLGLVIFIQGIASWAGMWSFLPDVVLATTSVKHIRGRVTTDTLPAVAFGEASGIPEPEIPDTEASDEESDHQDEPAFEEVPAPPEESFQERETRNMQYGTLISCIDFGDQLGALVLGVLVRSMDVSRENNWGRLAGLIQVCALLNACSAVLVVILR